MGRPHLVRSTPIVDWFGECVRPAGAGRSAATPSRRSGPTSGNAARVVTSAPSTRCSTTACSCRAGAAAGNDADLRVYPEAIHSFTAFPLEVASVANAAQEDECGLS